MPANQMVLSRELMTVMRKAVTYAMAAESEFVQPPHVLLALLDDETIGPRLSQLIERERAQAAAPRKRPPEQLRDPDSQRAPFPIYRSLVIRTPDGKDGKWLDQDSYEIFMEGARRVQAGAYLPKHLAKAYVSESNRDRGLLAILGHQPAVVAEKIFAL
ncbi:MAG: hypothetical protein JO349_05950 [Candidatus Eremiobacteraeota bacterium]|nr:hypothetical protein [Candidatus Eremiobacteraeota bacterium]